MPEPRTDSTDGVVYSVSNGVTVIVFAAVFMAFSWLTMFFMASETVSCQRVAGQPRCRLSRQVAGVPLRSRDLGVVQAVSVDDQHSPAQSYRMRGGTTYWIRYDTEHGPVEGSSIGPREDCERLVAGLQQFLGEPADSDFSGTLEGHFIAMRVMPALFLFGVVGLLNGVSIVRKSGQSVSP